MSKLIILVGPKHSGKTRTGRALATQIHARYCDLDELVEQAQGKSVRQIYLEGQDKFQACELAALQSVIAPSDKKSALVVSAGGGLCDNAAASELLRAARLASPKQVIVVALEVNASTAWARIKKTGRIPPFLQTDNPEATHRMLHERRTQAYRELAGMRIQVDGKQEKDVSAELRYLLG
jgi:shikimate kinase